LNNFGGGVIIPLHLVPNIFLGFIQRVGNNKLMVISSGEVCSKMEQLRDTKSVNKKISLVGASN
jgi:hypothetical protein